MDTTTPAQKKPQLLKSDAMPRGQDGFSKVRRLGLKRSFSGDIYHQLLSMPWRYFLILFSCLYLAMNCIFGSLYYFLGDNILNADPNSFMDAFYFSFQTSATIGYGHLLPKTTLAHIIVIFDTLSGLIFVAVSTGLAFAKFSRPTSNVLFSNNMLITNLNGKRTLMFRVGNTRKSHIIDASVHAVLSRPELSLEGTQMRRLYDLKLQRKQTPLFGLSWTVMHTIDEKSPLYDMTEETLKSLPINVVISISGIDEVFKQTVYSRHIYWTSDFLYDQQFANLMGIDHENKTYIDYSQFHKVTPRNREIP